MAGKQYSNDAQFEFLVEHIDTGRSSISPDGIAEAATSDSGKRRVVWLQVTAVALLRRISSSEKRGSLSKDSGTKNRLRCRKAILLHILTFFASMDDLVWFVCRRANPL